MNVDSALKLLLRVSFFVVVWSADFTLEIGSDVKPVRFKCFFSSVVKKRKWVCIFDIVRVSGILRRLDFMVFVASF